MVAGGTTVTVLSASSGLSPAARRTGSPRDPNVEGLRRVGSGHRSCYLKRAAVRIAAHLWKSVKVGTCYSVHIVTRRRGFNQAPIVPAGHQTCRR
jgi:hypothetical protein